jgi:hypothetical protein
MLLSILKWIVGDMKQQLSLSIIRCFFHQNFNNKGIIPILLRKKEYYDSEQSEIEADQ